MKEKRFHNRGFITFLTGLSFLIMTITGVVLYFVPHGRIAYWVDWKFIALTKTDWDNMHIVSSIVFAAAGIYHIYYNWKALVNYIVNKVSDSMRLKKELYLASAISLFVIIGSIYLIPPVNYIIEFSGYLKDSWVSSKEYEPPFGHAEEFSLKVFTKKMNINLDGALTELTKQGITVHDTKESLKDIARANNTNPMILYSHLKEHEQKKALPAGTIWTADMVEETFSGTGVGRKTLSHLCDELERDLEDVRARLLDNNIDMKAEETMKKAADRYGVHSIDILKIILVANYKIR